MRFQKTHAGDIPALSALWKQAFADDDAEIARFFREAFPHTLGFGAKEGETLAAMCFALPVQAVCGEQSHPAAYLYAVATDRARRGEGICRGLLAFAEKELRKRGTEVLLLVPADEGLAAMYRKLGFTGAACTQTPVCVPDPAGAAQEVGVIDYAGLRETLLWDVPHVRYARHWLDFAAHETHFYALRLGMASGCAAVRRTEDGALHIDELLPDVRLLPALVPVLAGAERVELHAGDAMQRWLSAPPDDWDGLRMPFDFG